MDFKISIIIPMYKARDYITENVDCLLNQTLPEIEIIIVNDCSPDDSMEICREHYAGNGRVQLIDQPRNMGPGAARNAGIKAAKGEYIAFVDSDDAVLPDAFEKIYEVAKTNDADVVHNTGVIFPLVKNAPANLLLVDEKDYLRIPTDKYDVATEVKTLSDDMMHRFEYWKKEAYHWAVWNKLYRRTYLLENNIHFGDMKLAEDLTFCFGCLFHAKKYVIMPGNFYLYRMAETSLCRGSDYTKLLDRALFSVLNAADIMNANMKGIAFFEEHAECAREAIDFVITNLETIYIRPAFQAIGEEGIRRDGIVKRLLDEKYGDRSDYVFFAFMELHKNYPEVEDVVKKGSDVDYLIKVRDEKREAYKAYKAKKEQAEKKDQQ